MLDGPGGRPTHRIAAVGALGRGALRVMLEGVSSAEAAAALKGRIVMIDPAELPAARPGEFYYFQALGCEVTTVGGETLGTVAEIFPTGANDVMVVRAGTREILVPVIADVIRSIDLAARRVVVDPIPGLLD
jgi:16S rRNA processing protein RimM